MEAILFFKAALIGLSIAAPVGPIGLLCIQRTLAHGAKVGFASGFGAASADACYGAVGAFGMSALIQVFVALATPLALAGALFIGWMGVQTWRAAPAGQAAGLNDEIRPARAFASVFALTLTNPMTILSFIAVFAAIGGATQPAFGDALVMVSGVFAGSALWWIMLALGVASIRHKLGPVLVRNINRVAGALLLGFATWQLAGLIAEQRAPQQGLYAVQKAAQTPAFASQCGFCRLAWMGRRCIRSCA